MGLLDMLSAAAKGGQQNNQQQQATNPQPGQPNANGTPSSTAPINQPNTLGVPHAGAEPANNQPPANPLDAFANLFDTSKDKPNVPPSFTLPDDALNKVVEAQNFTQGVPQDLMQKALSGDPQAMLQAMNATAQQAYRAALAHGSTLSDQYINTRLTHERGVVQGDIKNVMTSAELFNLGQGAQHQTVRDSMTATAQRLQALNPDASPQQIATMTKQYYTEMANAINGTPNNQSNANGQNGQQENFDWGKYLGFDN